MQQHRFIPAGSMLVLSKEVMPQCKAMLPPQPCCTPTLGASQFISKAFASGKEIGSGVCPPQLGMWEVLYTWFGCVCWGSESESIEAKCV